MTYEEISDFLASQAAIHQRLGNQSWADCLNAYARSVRETPERHAYVDAVVSAAMRSGSGSGSGVARSLATPDPKAADGDHA